MLNLEEIGFLTLSWEHGPYFPLPWILCSYVHWVPVQLCSCLVAFEPGLADMKMTRQGCGYLCLCKIWLIFSPVNILIFLFFLICRLNFCIILTFIKSQDYTRSLFNRNLFKLKYLIWENHCIVVIQSNESRKKADIQMAVL